MFVQEPVQFDLGFRFFKNEAKVSLPYGSY